MDPHGELERLLVDRIVAGYWRLRRLGRVEAGIYVWEHYEEIAERAEREAKSYEKKYYRRGLWDRDAELEISDEKRHGEALSSARQMRKENRRTRTPPSAGPSPETPTGRTHSPSSPATRPP